MPVEEMMLCSDLNLLTHNVIMEQKDFLKQVERHVTVIITSLKQRVILYLVMDIHQKIVVFNIKSPEDFSWHENNI